MPPPPLLPPGPPPTPDELRKFSQFIDTLRPGQIALALFETIPDVLFWMKDAEDRMIYVNRAFCELLQLTSSEIIGKMDVELFPAELARVFTADDIKIRKTTKPLMNKMELVTRRAGGIEWRMTTKIPLLNRTDQVVGTAGISRRLDQREGHPLPAPYRALSRLVDFVHTHVNKTLSVEELAQQAGMSISTLERRFRNHLGTSPKRFILHAKVAAACERLLNTPLSVGEISESLGYQEHASFTRAFSSVMHMSPTAYRKYYQLRP